MPFATALAGRRGWAGQVAVAVAAGRVGIGVVALVRPDVITRAWIGEDDGPGATVLGRALGGRDLALGLGLLLAANHGRPIRGWTEAAALADTADVLATLMVFNRLPRRGRVAVLAAAGLAAAADWLAARSVD